MFSRVQAAAGAACAVGALAMLPAGATAGSQARPHIRTAEVGYFGGATVTHQFEVFVYSNLGPRAGNHVTVCVGGVCKRAHGHNSRLAWFSATFHSSGLQMGQPVTFTATAADASGHSSRTFTSGLLCMHNNGSTPQA